MSRIASASVLLALALTATACGDADGDEPDAAPSTPQPTFTVDKRRTTGLFSDLNSILLTVEESLQTTGELPSAEVVSESTYSAPRPRVDYRPTSDGRGFRMCLHHAKRGPWVTYDTARGGVVSLGSKGTCSYEPPAPGSAAEVRRDQLQLLATRAPDWVSCDDVPSVAELRAEGSLGKGNRIDCRLDSYQEGEVEVLVFCVQHGDDGPWTTYDGVGLFARGDDGPCRLDIGQQAD